MKILQVISSFPPAYAYGGALKVAHEISKELVKKGHEVTVYTTDVYNASSRFKYNENPMSMGGINVYYYKNISNKLAHGNFAISPMMAFALDRNIKDFDIIHLHEYRSFQAILVYHYAKKYGIPYILQAHGSVLPFFQKQGLKKIFDIIFGYNILKDASKVIALTQTEAEQYKKMGMKDNKIGIVPNGIDLSEYENLPDIGTFRNKYGIKSDEKIILYLGRVHKIKGVDMLIDAFSNLVSKMEGVTLVIAGPDNGFLSVLKAQIKDLKISDRIIFTGSLYEKDKLDAYVDADIYVLPSVYETFPMTVLEALACCKPVIVTDRCGIADIIKKVGFVVKYDKNQLSDAIYTILQDKKLRSICGENGKKLIKKSYEWSTITEQFERMYEICPSYWKDNKER